jgi:hypothetical protein
MRPKRPEQLHRLASPCLLCHFGVLEAAENIHMRIHMEASVGICHNISSPGVAILESMHSSFELQAESASRTLSQATPGLVEEERLVCSLDALDAHVACVSLAPSSVRSKVFALPAEFFGGLLSDCAVDCKADALRRVPMGS